MGVTLYCLFYGRCPIQAENIVSLYAKILHDRIEFPEPINPSLKDLLQRMLDKDMDTRIAIREIHEHPWVTNQGQDPMPSEEENCKLVDVTDEDLVGAVKPTTTGGFAKFVCVAFTRHRKANLLFISAAGQAQQAHGPLVALERQWQTRQWYNGLVVSLSGKNPAENRAHTTK